MYYLNHFYRNSTITTSEEAQEYNIDDPVLINPQRDLASNRQGSQASISKGIIIYTFSCKFVASQSYCYLSVCNK